MFSGNNSAASAAVFSRIPHLVKGVIAQFFYVGAQVGVGSFAIRFANMRCRERWTQCRLGGQISLHDRMVR